MKTLCFALVALACALAFASAEKQHGRRLKSMMPMLPSVKERRQAHHTVINHKNRALRVPAAVAGFKRPNEQGQAGKAFAKTKTSFLFNRKVQPAVKAEREPQPDFAGRVDVKAPSGDLRIVNGNKAVLGQFPWQAGVLADFGSDGEAWCGGSIIHSLWILTAGHCVDDLAVGYQISVGSLGSETGSEPTRQVWKGLTEFYQHPAYSPYFIDNDVSLIKLTDHIQLSAYARPVRLPSYSMATDMMTGTTGTVSGWGKHLDADSWITSELLYINNTINDGSACFDYYGNAWIANKICIDNSDGHSFCSGDSGGAFTIVEDDGQHTQLGIVSFGSSAGCEQGLPTAYTRVASFLDFIEETTNIAIRD